MLVGIDGHHTYFVDGDTHEATFKQHPESILTTARHFEDTSDALIMRDQEKLENFKSPQKSNYFPLELFSFKFFWVHMELEMLRLIPNNKS